MSTEQTCAIRRVVDHHQGPTALARLLGGTTYQEVQRWLGQGYASPAYLLRLAPLLPTGITLADLDADRAEAVAKRRAAKEAAA